MKYISIRIPILSKSDLFMFTILNVSATVIDQGCCGCADFIDELVLVWRHLAVSHRNHSKESQQVTH